MVLVVDDRLAAVGELEVGEAEAGDRPRRHQRGDVGLEHHLVGDPDGAEEAEPLRVAADVGEDRLGRRPGQRPPLRAEARLEPGREAPPHPERRLDAAPRAMLGEVLGLVVEDVPEAPALRAPAAGDPALVLGLDELAPGVLEKEALEARHRPAGQAGARQQDRVVGRPSGPRPRPRPGRARSAAPRPGRSRPSGRRRGCATRPIRGSSATAAASPSKARASARASKWISARASEPAATRVRASSAASAGRSWARITNRSFIEGRRLPSDMDGNGHSGLGAGPA